MTKGLERWYKAKILKSKKDKKNPGKLCYRTFSNLKKKPNQTWEKTQNSNFNVFVFRPLQRLEQEV